MYHKCGKHVCVEHEMYVCEQCVCVCKKVNKNNYLLSSLLQRFPSSRSVMNLQTNSLYLEAALLYNYKICRRTQI
jgi:hypothetical protein